MSDKKLWLTSNKFCNSGDNVVLWIIYCLQRFKALRQFPGQVEKITRSTSSFQQTSGENSENK